MPTQHPYLLHNFDNIHTADERVSCTVYHNNPHEIYRFARNVIQNTISEDAKISNCNSGNNDTMLPVKSTDPDSMQCYSDNEDKDLAEDQAALDQRQELTGDALPTVIQLDNLENQVFQCAPGEHNILKYILLDTDFEVLAFPNLFPYGYGGYYSEGEPKNLGICKYFQQCLLKVDVRFTQNIEYIFCAQHIVDLKQIQSDANLAIRLSQGRLLSGQKVTAGILHNHEALQQLVRTKQAYKFLKNIRGSPAYWQNELYISTAFGGGACLAP